MGRGSRPSERAEAFVLRSVDYRDADRVLTLLTSSHGRISVLARSARSSRRRFAGALEPFGLIEVEFSLGSRELHTLRQARLLRAFPELLTKLEALDAAGQATQTLRRLTAPSEQPDPRLLPSVERFYELLSLTESADAEPFASIRVAFELRLLAIIGLFPNLQQCVQCGREAPEGKAGRFDPALGGLRCSGCGAAPRSILLPRGSREALMALGTSGWDEAGELSTAFLRVARQLIDAHLEFHS